MTQVIGFVLLQWETWIEFPPPSLTQPSPRRVIVHI